MMSSRCDVLARDNINDYYRQISLILGVHRTNVLKNSLLCHSCNKCPDVVDGYTCAQMPWLMSFECKSCPMTWGVCKECQIEDQPTLPGNNTKRMRKDLRQDLFEVSLFEHHENYHSNINELENEDDDEDSNETDNDLLLYHENEARCGYSLIEARSIEVSLELAKAQLFSDDDNRMTSASKNLVTDMVMAKETEGSYAEFLIKKCWVKNDEVTLKREDCDLFLKVVKELVLSSRDCNQRFMFIVEKVESRHFSDNLKKDGRISKLEEEVHLLKERNKALMDIIHSVESLDAMTHTYMMSKVSDVVIGSFEEFNESVTTNVDSSNPVMDLLLPSTMSEARHLLENRNSFVQSLPIPPIHCQNVDGYTYVLPSDVLELSLAFGVDTELVYDNEFHENVTTLPDRSIFRTQNMINKITTNSVDDDENRSLYVPIAIWSDGFDAGSQAKSNRSLVKLTTLHIPHPTISKEQVFPIGLGRHLGDHENIWRVIWDDVQALSRSPRLCYIPKLKRTIPVKFILSYLIMDRPEHSEWTGFASHAGLYSTIPGRSCPIAVQRSSNQTLQSAGVHVIRPLSSCTDCYSRRILRYNANNIRDYASSSLVCEVCDD